MTPPDVCFPQAWRRALLLAGVVTLGLAGIVGSGGGAGGLPGDCPPGTDCGPPPPSPAAQVQPAYDTVLAGTAVTWTATAQHLAGPLDYQWSRSSDGGTTWTDIAGATAATYTLAGATLADDGAQFRVTVQGTGASAQAVARLVVSATPGLVFEDGEMADGDWIASAVDDANEPAPLHVETHETTGGHPDAWRRMVFTLPAGAGSGRVFYMKPAATYDPQALGAIHVIDYAEDCIALQASTTLSTQSNLALAQSGRRYLSNTDGVCTSTQWSAAPGRASLAAADFRLFDGPPCGVGESCPDFSPQAAPITFGYWRITFGTPGDVIGHGIDNWRVTVWPR